MEPISAVASILTLLGAGGKISNGLRKLINLRNAPDAVLALNNEVTDFHLLVSDIEDLLHECGGDIDIPHSLFNALDRAKRKLLELESFIAYEVTIPSNDPREGLRVDRSRLLRAERKILSLQQSLRDDRLALSAALHVLSSKLSSRHVQVTKRTEYGFEGIDNVVTNLQTMMTEVLDQRQDLTQRSTQSLQTSPIRVGYLESFVSGEVASSSATNRGNITSISMIKDSGKSSAVADFPSLKITRRKCPLDCNCRCHYYTSIRTPRYLETLFGSLFIGYRASPFARQPCDVLQCRPHENRSELTYKFPTMFMRGVIHATFSYANIKGPELNIRMMNVRSYLEWPMIWWLVRDHRTIFVEACRQLSAGETSVYDIDQMGRSLLYYAARARNFNLAKVLIENGSDATYKDQYGLLPVAMAWESELQYGAKSRESISNLQDVFFNPLNVNETLFTLLHEAYLGIKNLDAEEVARNTPRSMLDMPDAYGKTVLLWAAGRGDSVFVAKLLDLGANVHVMNHDGHTALHMATLAHCTATARLLIDAGANVNALDKTLYSVLYFAAKECDLEMVKLLLDNGADIEPGNDIRKKPLFSAILFYDRVEIVRLLLERGAELHEVHWMLVFRWNCYLVLRFFLSELEIPEFSSPLETISDAVRNIDIKTIGILAELYSGPIDLDAVDSYGYTARDIALCRRDRNDELAIAYHRRPDPDPVAWYDAFMNMIETVNAGYAQLKKQAGRRIEEDSTTEGENDEPGIVIGGGMGAESSSINKDEERHKKSKDQVAAQDEEEAFVDAVESIDAS